MWAAQKDFASLLTCSSGGPVSWVRFRVPESVPEFGHEPAGTHSEFPRGWGHILGQNVGPSWGIVFRPAQRFGILGQKMVHIMRARVMHEKNSTRLLFAAWTVMQWVVLVLACAIPAVCVHADVHSWLLNLLHLVGMCSDVATTSRWCSHPRVSRALCRCFVEFAIV